MSPGIAGTAGGPADTAAQPPGRWPVRLLELGPALGLALALAGGVVLGRVALALGWPGLVGLPVVLAGGGLLARRLLSRSLAPVYAVVAAVPVGLRPVPGNPFGLKVMQAVALVAVAAVVVRRLAAGRTPLPLPAPLAWALALLAQALVAVAVAGDQGRAVKQWAAVAVAVLLCGAVADSCRGARRVGDAALALVLAATVTTAAALASAGSVQATAAAGVVNGRATGSFAQPNELGSFASLVLLVSLGLLVAARGRARVLPAVAAASAAAALVISLSRGAWLGTAAGLVLLAVLVPSVRRPLAAALVSLLVVLAASTTLLAGQPLAGVVAQRVASLGDTSRNPYDDRPTIWGEALRQIGAHPLLGVGPDNYPVVALTSPSRAVEVGPVHAHNVPLTVAAEAGLPALALLVGLTLATARSGVTAYRRARGAAGRAVVAGLLAGLLAVVVQGCIDMTLRNGELLLTVSLVAGLLLAAARPAARGR